MMSSRSRIGLVTLSLALAGAIVVGNMQIGSHFRGQVGGGRKQYCSTDTFLHLSAPIGVDSNDTLHVRGEGGGANMLYDFFTLPQVQLTGNYRAISWVDAAPPSWMINDNSGNVWFNEGGKVAKLSGGTLTETAVTPVMNVLALALGPDGNVWLSLGSKIGKLANGVITLYPLPAGVASLGIAAGPDNKMWFTNLSSNQIGTIAMDGTVQMTDLPQSVTGLYRVLGDANGTLWFTVNGESKIVVRSPAGVFTTVSMPFEGYFFTLGPDGSAWVTGGADDIGAVSPAGILTLHVGLTRPRQFAFNSQGTLFYLDDNGFLHTATEGACTDDGGSSSAGSSSSGGASSSFTSSPCYACQTQCAGGVATQSCQTCAHDNCGPGSTCFSSSSSSSSSSVPPECSGVECALGAKQICQSKVPPQGCKDLTMKKNDQCFECSGNCGNGQLDFGEECEDSNTRDGDGCSGTCKLESGFCSIDGGSSSSSSSSSSGRSGGGNICCRGFGGGQTNVCIGPSEAQPACAGGQTTYADSQQCQDACGGFGGGSSDSGGGGSQCSDTDLDDPTTQGTVTYSGQSHTDSCTSDRNMVHEWTCGAAAVAGGYAPAEGNRTCPIGTACQDGACKALAGWTLPSQYLNLCADTDSGIHPLQKGTVTHNGNAATATTDFCRSSTVVAEHFCAGGVDDHQAGGQTWFDLQLSATSSADIPCPAGTTCSNGACQ